MTGQTLVPYVAPCKRCHRPHLNPQGRVGCRAHLARRDEVGLLVPCGMYRLKGLDVCGKHGGNTRAGKAKRTAFLERERYEKALASVVKVYGIPREVDPAIGLIESYWRSAGIVDALEKLVATLAPDELGFGVISETVTAKRAEQALDFAGNPVDVEPEIETRTIRGARQHVWVKEYNNERDRFERLGADIVRLGLEARRDEYVRAQVDVFASVIYKLNLSDEQRKMAAQLLRDLDGRPRVVTGEVVGDGPV